MKAVENNVSYKDGDEIQPLSVDLSGQKTVVTGGDIVIEMRRCLIEKRQNIILPLSLPIN